APVVLDTETQRVPLVELRGVREVLEVLRLGVVKRNVTEISLVAFARLVVPTRGAVAHVASELRDIPVNAPPHAATGRAAKPELGGEAARGVLVELPVAAPVPHVPVVLATDSAVVGVGAADRRGGDVRPLGIEACYDL